MGKEQATSQYESRQTAQGRGHLVPQVMKPWRRSIYPQLPKCGVNLEWGRQQRRAAKQDRVLNTQGRCECASERLSFHTGSRMWVGSTFEGEEQAESDPPPRESH